MFQSVSPVWFLVQLGIEVSKTRGAYISTENVRSRHMHSVHVLAILACFEYEDVHTWILSYPTCDHRATSPTTADNIIESITHCCWLLKFDIDSK